MKNQKKLLVVLSAVVLAGSVNLSMAATKPATTTPAAVAAVEVKTKIAVVDVTKVVNESKEVQAIKKDKEKKTQELMAFIENARKDVAFTTDEKKKEALEKKYNKQLNDKKEAMDKDYANKLNAIDKKISDTINAQAKAAGYDMVLVKGIVLYGGDEITDKVIKALK
ncbi:MAG: OmpH family outer membrane protein [Candidatus Gastranaerophilales bacterium]